MTSRLLTLKTRDLIKVLKKIGFYEVRRKGGYIFFQHLADGRTTVIPYHKSEDIGRGLLRQTLREIELSPEEFIKILHS
jgi:predicted RNA binding protein YcfA (HicA-like mRNA interferase family)